MTSPDPPPAEILEPVTCNVAGVQLTITKDRAQGSFHDIPVPLWNAIIGFHRAVSIAHAAESISYHKWNAATLAYDTIIPWQKTSGHGLSVAVDWKDEKNIALLDAYGKATGETFFPACTIHTHVDVAAFESGTDARDEEDMPGWHITLGNLVSHAEYDLDFRMRLPKIPKVTKRTNADCKYQLAWRHLFHSDVGRAVVFQSPGTTDFHDKLDRIIVR